jgi:Deoxyribonuclease II
VEGAPVPLLEKGQPVDWWFVFKFNTAASPACRGSATRQCLFGGEVQQYKAFSQQYVFASSGNPSLQEGSNCAGDTTGDPIGATFDQVYNGSFHYVIWNDQFYDDPPIAGCTKECGAPWGHSKGLLAWNEAGEGFVMQVTTPSWPAAGNVRAPRKTDGNTLGCVKDDDVEVSQHFFALKLTKDDVIKILMALQNASVVTDPTNPQIVKNGGPREVQELVVSLGTRSDSKLNTKVNLSSGVELISKPSHLNVPPWQMVSAVLGGIPLRAATWWANPKIYTTTQSTEITCWDDHLGTPGPVEIATTGQWTGKILGLTGGSGPNFNHAKLGVSTSGNDHYSIFGDMNQQGAVSGEKCSSSQNGRGGLFYVVNDRVLFDNLKQLISGSAAPTAPTPD